MLDIIREREREKEHISSTCILHSSVLYNMSDVTANVQCLPPKRKQMNAPRDKLGCMDMIEKKMFFLPVLPNMLLF